MKTRILLFVSLILAAFSATAQDNPYLTTGRSFIGGGLSLDISHSDPDNGNPTTTDENNRFAASLSPTYGKFYNDRWMVGVSLTVSYQSYRQRNTQEDRFDESLTREVGMGLIPFLRRYLPVTERFGVYVQPEISYTYWRGTSEFERRDTSEPAANSFNSTITRRHVGSLGTQLGLYYFITPHFSIETNLLQAAFTFSSRNAEQTFNDNVVDTVNKSTDLNARLNLVNQLSFDRILVLNYYF